MIRNEKRHVMPLLQRMHHTESATYTTLYSKSRISFKSLVNVLK